MSAKSKLSGKKKTTDENPVSNAVSGEQVAQKNTSTSSLESSDPDELQEQQALSPGNYNLTLEIANPSPNLVLKWLDKFDKRFDAFDQKIDAVDQKKLENHGAKTYPLFTRLENGIEAPDEKIGTYSQLLTGMDPMARNYEQFMRDRDIIDAEHHDLMGDVETLKKRDMEKAAAIGKIEKEIDKLKAA